MSILEEVSNEVGKAVKEVSKVSSEFLEKQKIQNELRALKRNKNKVFLELGKRIYTICEEGEELKREDFEELIIKINNIDELIKNTNYKSEQKKEEPEEDLKETSEELSQDVVE